MKMQLKIGQIAVFGEMFKSPQPPPPPPLPPNREKVIKNPVLNTESVKRIVGGTLKRLLLHTTPCLKEPGKAFGDYRTQDLLSSLLHSGLCSKSFPHSPHTPLGQIRNNPPV